MGVDYVGFIYLDAGVAEESLGKLVGRGGGHLAPLGNTKGSQHWYAVDIRDSLLQSGTDDALLEMLREWSRVLGCTVCVVEQVDQDLQLVMFEKGECLRHLQFSDAIWQRAQGKPQEWEKVLFERADWTDVDDFADGSPDRRAADHRRIVKDARFPGVRAGWLELAGFPLEPTHAMVGGGPRVGEVAKDAARAGGVGLGVLVAIFFGVGLLSLLLFRCAGG
ncbi:MAG: hypothetical protein R3B13_16370 [Polyangiaceae bacterium]